MSTRLDFGFMRNALADGIGHLASLVTPPHARLASALENARTAFRHGGPPTERAKTLYAQLETLTGEWDRTPVTFSALTHVEISRTYTELFYEIDAAYHCAC